MPPDFSAFKVTPARDANTAVTSALDFAVSSAIAATKSFLLIKLSSSC